MKQQLAQWFSRLIAPSLWLGRFITQPKLGEQICTTCGQIGIPQRRRRGLDRVEIGLWVGLGVFAAAYIFTSLIHYTSWHVVRFPFPGMIVRLFSLLTKLFLLLSPVYTIWRVSTEYQACPKCEHPSMIPLDSPRGQAVREQQQKK